MGFCISGRYDPENSEVTGFWNSRAADNIKDADQSGFVYMKKVLIPRAYIPPVWFAFPFGAHNETLRKIKRKMVWKPCSLYRQVFDVRIITLQLLM